MKKILITGGGGILAQYVQTILPANSFYAPLKSELDISSPDALEKVFDQYAPEIVFHLAAKTNVDECESKPQEAFEVNGESTNSIAKLCKEYQSFLVYVSSSAVFDGKKDIYYEDDIPSPVNIYGKSKLLGEKYIQDFLPQFLVVRAGWLIGGGTQEKKFISYIIERAKKGEREMPVVSDKFGTLTYARELADFIYEAIKDKKTGIYHFGSLRVCSRVDIAQKVIETLKLNMKITPVKSNYFSNAFSAPRPDREVIGSKKIKYEKNWEESLENYLSESYNISNV